MSCHPTDESRIDCMMQAEETGKAYDGCTDIYHQLAALKRLDELGLIESDEPHPAVHLVAVENAQAEFTPQERRKIRVALGMENAF